MGNLPGVAVCDANDRMALGGKPVFNQRVKHLAISCAITSRTSVEPPDGRPRRSVATVRLKSYRVQRYDDRSLKRDGLSLAVALTTMLLPSWLIPAHAQSPLPTKWGDLPAPETLVRLDTPNGSFKLPMGYLSDWFVLKDSPAVVSEEGTRVFSGSFSVHFTFPGGKTDVKAWDTPEVSDIYADAMQDLSVVWIYGAAPYLPCGRVYPERDVLDRYAPGRLSLEPSMSIGRLQQVYLGVAAGPAPGRRIGIAMSCATNCGVSMYFEKQRLVLSGLIAGRFRDRVLEIAALTQKLYDKWSTSEIGNH